MNSAQNVNQGTFTGPVFTNQGMHFAPSELKTNPVQGPNAGKGFDNIVRFQNNVTIIFRDLRHNSYFLIKYS